MNWPVIALATLLAVSNIVSRETKAAPGDSEARERPAGEPAQPSVPVRIIARTPEPRGGEGTFQQRWAKRVSRDPNDGVVSFFTDRLGAYGNRLYPERANPPVHYCAHPDPSELGQRFRVTGPGGSIVCEVADIGPAPRLRRALDLLPAGFKAIGLRPIDGLGWARIERAE